ncbi:sensor histidine kinase [Streptomyces albidoflavus]|uniref:sensor histidine kinase n=1 Tax=Streptomyces TaxID=1883 RepID=UPI0013DBECC0|nr:MULTISPECIES: sensor histidine kinase [unclassified Streptomyces]NEC97505.1 sensor histidine kinase [Streptomyces albidoflavus]UKL04020.1 sensor domain-containing protein [Streptomyces sp. NBU3104]WST06630.1 sensor domain-containing protein [Streptomyces albidoflavus]
MHARTAWQALAHHPLAFLATLWPWRALAYLLSGVGVGALTLVVLVAGLLTGLVLLPLGVGAVVLLAVVLGGGVVARVERWRLRLVDLDPAATDHRAPDAPGVRAWLRTRLRDRLTWRELGFTAVSMTALWWMDLLVLAFALALPVLCVTAPLDDPGAWPWVVIGLALLPAAPYTVTGWAGARAALTRLVLAPRDAELTEVRASRARLVGAFDAERRRIERDLHDGAQQRLVSVNVMLGLARLDAGPGTPLGRRLDLIQGELTTAVGELRELSRGVHPRALTDQGLAAALTNLTARSPLPVTVDVALPGPLPASVASTAYFVVAEALANATKHSGAGRAEVRARLRTDTLVLTVHDDGSGGADPAGRGLTGLADRVAAADGILRLSSPSGGPTLLHVEMPCH